VCDAVNSLHKALDGSENPRPNGMLKKDVIKVCAKSVADSLKNIDHEFHIVGDRVSDETWNFLLDLFKPKSSFNSEEALYDSGSLLKCSEIAMSFEDNDFIYFLEDDYLHDASSFHRLFSFLEESENFGFDFFIHPTDYPDRYKNLIRSYIIQTKNGYWREVDGSTHTLMCYKKSYKKYVDFFRECHQEDGNDGKMSSIFMKEALCFSPLPGIASHFHKGAFSNYIDWESIYLKYA
jgi:hypothetical protein